jgi:hypothetical protein
MAPKMSFAVIEPDSTYQWPSTPPPSGGCRVQFTTPQNARMSLFSIDFIKSYDRTMSVDGSPT